MQTVEYMLLGFLAVAAAVLIASAAGVHPPLVVASPDASVLYVYRDVAGIGIRFAFKNPSSDMMVIRMVSVEDGDGRLIVYGDGGSLDGLEAYDDTFTPVTVPPGESVMIEVYHYAPATAIPSGRVVVTIHYEYRGRVYEVSQAARVYAAPPPPGLDEETMHVSHPDYSGVSPVSAATITLTYNRGEAMYVDWVGVRITRAQAPLLFNSTAPPNIIVVDALGFTMQSRIVYYDYDAGLIVVAIRIADTVEPGEQITLRVLLRGGAGTVYTAGSWQTVDLTLVDVYTVRRLTNINYTEIRQYAYYAESTPDYYTGRASRQIPVVNFTPPIAYAVSFENQALGSGDAKWVGNVYLFNGTSFYYIHGVWRISVYRGTALLVDKTYYDGETTRYLEFSPPPLNYLSPDADITIESPVKQLVYRADWGENGKNEYVARVYAPNLPGFVYTYHLFSVSVSPAS